MTQPVEFLLFLSFLQKMEKIILIIAHEEAQTPHRRLGDHVSVSNMYTLRTISGHLPKRQIRSVLFCFCLYIWTPHDILELTQDTR